MEEALEPYVLLSPDDHDAFTLFYQYKTACTVVRKGGLQEVIEDKKEDKKQDKKEDKKVDRFCMKFSEYKKLYEKATNQSKRERKRKRLNVPDFFANEEGKIMFRKYTGWSTFITEEDFKERFKGSVEHDGLWHLREGTPLPKEIKLTYDPNNSRHVLFSPAEDVTWSARQFKEILRCLNWVKLYKPLPRPVATTVSQSEGAARE